MSEINQPDTKEIESNALSLLAQSQSKNVMSNDDYLQAGEHLKTIKAAHKKVVELFKPLKDAAFVAHRKICDAEKKLLEPINEADKVCSDKVKFYLSEVRRRENEEATRLKKEAEEKAAAESAKLKKEQDDERIRIAEMLDKQGFKEEAVAILEQDLPAPVVTPVIQSVYREEVKIKGQHLRDNYKSEVYDLAALVQEVAAGRQPLTILLPNEKVLNQMAKALKEDMRIPGVRVINESTLVVKT